MFFISAILKGADQRFDPKAYCLSKPPYPYHRLKASSKSRMICAELSIDKPDRLNKTCGSVLSVEASTSSDKFVEEQGLIREHSLYPVLKMLAVKCESATTSSSFNDFDTNDVMRILLDLRKNGRSIDTDNKDVDTLMIAAIIELRIQLKQLQQLHIKAEKCKKQMNDDLKKTQGKLATILQNELQNSDHAILPIKRRPQGFTIADLLADTPSF